MSTNLYRRSCQWSAPLYYKTENWMDHLTEIADLATARGQGLSSAGTNTVAFAAGGNPGNLTSMEVLQQLRLFKTSRRTIIF